jgi:hypothetical protein
MKIYGFNKIGWIIFLFIFMMPYQAHAEWDPTHPEYVEYIVNPKEIDKLNVTMIVKSELYSFAIINGQEVKKGARINGFNIYDIDQNVVYLEKSNQRFKLMLG